MIYEIDGSKMMTDKTTMELCVIKVEISLYIVIRVSKQKSFAQGVHN
jgi:hypothetical protein